MFIITSLWCHAIILLLQYSYWGPWQPWPWFLSFPHSSLAHKHCQESLESWQLQKSVQPLTQICQSDGYWSTSSVKSLTLTNIWSQSFYHRCDQLRRNWWGSLQLFSGSSGFSSDSPSPLRWISLPVAAFPAWLRSLLCFWLSSRNLSCSLSVIWDKINWCQIFLCNLSGHNCNIIINNWYGEFILTKT